MSNLNLLRLLHLADSALPIGALAHSFGVETMIGEGSLVLSDLFPFLKNLLTESLLLDAVFCRCAYRRSFCKDMGDLNSELSAFKLARESRDASLAMGRRFVSLVGSLELGITAELDDSHFAVAFGYASGILSLGIEETVGAFLHQSVTATISACQRLLRLGQSEAGEMLWDLKPFILDAVSNSDGVSLERAGSFVHLPELSSMRHPMMPTRLFLS
jgi:urease accessory protein